MRVCTSITSAIDLWISHGLKPGSCTELLLRGEYERAFQHAHPIIKPYFADHIKYVELISEECRGENFDTWKGNES